MTQVFVDVPKGMSYINAWFALYRNAPDVSDVVSTDSPLMANRETEVATWEKVVLIFKKYPIGRETLYWMDSEGGKPMHVHFHRFPVLEVSQYDLLNGAGAAFRALKEYNAMTPSAKRFDPHDRCSFAELRRCTCVECCSQERSSFSQGAMVSGEIEEKLRKQGIRFVRV